MNGELRDVGGGVTGELRDVGGHEGTGPADGLRRQSA